MNSITDWLMVGITAVYVVATVLILLANRKAVKAAKEQLEESKREFEETRRLGLMPYICFSETNSKLTDYDCHLELDDHINRVSYHSLRMSVKNVGLGTAKDMVWNYENYEHQTVIPFPVVAIQNGEEFSVCLIFHYPSDSYLYETAYLVLRYKDLLNRSYRQRISFEFDYDNKNNLHFTRRIQTFPPELI